MLDSLIENTTLSVSQQLRAVAAKSDHMRAAVAYMSNADFLEEALKSGKSVDLLIALQFPTDPKLLRHLINFYPERLKLHFFSSRFHSKLFLFSAKDRTCYGVVGSSNLTGGGLANNIETNVLLHEPSVLAKLNKHFDEVWAQSARLEPSDIDAFQEHWNATAEARKSIQASGKVFERRRVLPRLNGKVGSTKKLAPRTSKEAQAYYQFWKVVDDVAGLVRKRSAAHWPTVPLYLAVDHFWHWLVKIWDKQEQKEIASNPKFRSKMLPVLFDRYARWDKENWDYTATDMMDTTRHLKRVLGKRNIEKLTKSEAKALYGMLHSGSMPTRRFSADAEFAKKNSIHEIRKSLKYLLWADDDIVARISALLPNGQLRLNRLGPSNVQELVGWVHPEKLPIRNKKADAAAELLGYKFR